MRNILGLFMVIISFFCLSMQNAPRNCIIEGKVKDESLLPIEGVTILLLSQEDSSFIKAVSSDKDGKFLMNGIQPGRYILQVTMIGYKREKRDISLTDNWCSARQARMKVSCAMSGTRSTSRTMRPIRRSMRRWYLMTSNS